MGTFRLIELYRLCSYVNVSIIAALLVHLTDHDGQFSKSMFSQLFIGMIDVTVVFSMVVSV